MENRSGILKTRNLETSSDASRSANRNLILGGKFAKEKLSLRVWFASSVAVQEYEVCPTARLKSTKRHKINKKLKEKKASQGENLISKTRLSSKLIKDHRKNKEICIVIGLLLLFFLVKYWQNICYAQIVFVFKTIEMLNSHNCTFYPWK